MYFIDKLGRKPLLSVGVAGIALSMFLLAFEFNSATYQLTPEKMYQLSSKMEIGALESLNNITYESESEFKVALIDNLGKEEFEANKEVLLKHRSFHEFDANIICDFRICSLLRIFYRACYVGVIF